MITNEEYQNRKWGHLPALRKLIEQIKVPGSAGPVLSTSDSDAQRLGRIIECGLTLHSLAPQIRERHDPDEVRPIIEDLSRFRDDLRWASMVFRSIDDEMGKLGADLGRHQRG